MFLWWIEVCLIKFSFKWRSKYFIWKQSAGAVHVAQNWLNLEKSLPFLQFSSKLSDFFFLWKNKSSSFSSSDQLLGAYLDLDRIRWLKNEWPCSVPSMVYFYYSQLPKKLWEVLMKIEGMQDISVLNGQNLGLIPHPSELISTHCALVDVHNKCCHVYKGHFHFFDLCGGCLMHWRAGLFLLS